MEKSTQIYCDGCEYLKHEDWPRGAGVLRCMREVYPNQKRVVNFSESNRFGATLKPVWCNKTEGETET